MKNIDFYLRGQGLPARINHFEENLSIAIPAISKNRFLMIWARDFIPNQIMEIPEYLVYFGIFIMQSWDKRSGQIAKGWFFEVAIT